MTESPSSQQSAAGEATPRPPRPALETLVARAGETGIREIVHAMLAEALSQGASALHLEPRRSGGIVRFRVAGELSPALILPPELLAPVTARFKVMANLDLAEHHAPQQGHIGVEHRGKPYEMPVATMPTVFGESMVVGIVDATAMSAWTWETLGVGPIAAVRELLERPHGLVLLTGPPGSGKTAMLYAALNALEVERRGVVMVAEEKAARVAGVSVSGAALPPAEAVRALIERDVDVLAIDEIRERAEIEAALEAALAGHLVLATFPAGDVIHAFERLIALGVSLTRVSGALAGILAARLVRRICPECREAYAPDAAALRTLGLTAEQPTVLCYRGKGCEHCLGAGYQGHTGLYQLLTIDAALGHLLAEGGTGDRLRGALAESGPRSFRELAWAQALAGVTTVEEALRFSEE